jgi:hypothetical protein
MLPEQFNTVVLVLKTGGDFNFQDVDILSYHLHYHYRGIKPLRVFCLYDGVNVVWELRNCTVLPMFYKEWKGWWSKMNLFSPEMEIYRPFLYLDLDTVVVKDISDLFDRSNEIITLEDFNIRNKSASGMIWIPAKNPIVSGIWESWIKSFKKHILKYRGDQDFIRTFITINNFWQSLTTKICSFKMRKGNKGWLMEIPDSIAVVCFHGHPRVREASKSVPWIMDYVQEKSKHPKVTVIIPYKINRGWLMEAINSVPEWSQVIVSQGEGTWPQNFNKALSHTLGDYVKFLHEDDELTENSLEDSVKAIEEQGVDFIHGKALSISESGEVIEAYQPPLEVTYEQLKESNPLHGGSLLFKKEIFDKIGGFDETLNHAEEYEFNLRCMYYGYRLGYCDSFLYKYRRHSGQKSNIDVVEMERLGKEISDGYKYKAL